jgi:hypothetical protein
VKPEAPAIIKLKREKGVRICDSVKREHMSDTRTKHEKKKERNRIKDDSNSHVTAIVNESERATHVFE